MVGFLSSHIIEKRKSPQVNLFFIFRMQISSHMESRVRVERVEEEKSIKKLNRLLGKACNRDRRLPLYCASHKREAMPLVGKVKI